MPSFVNNRLVRLAKVSLYDRLAGCISVRANEVGGLVVPIFLLFIFHFILNPVRRVAAFTWHWIWSRNFSFSLKNDVFFRDGHAISILLLSESSKHVPCSHSPHRRGFFSKIVTLSRCNSGTKSLKQNRIKNLLSNFFCSIRISKKPFWWDRHFNLHYYTSDSQWKIWLVESIQSIHNSLWTWHDKCIICCRYYIYHVKFNVGLVTNPLGVFSSETECLNVSLLFLRMNYVN